MHSYVLIPLIACIGASAMASAVVARDPEGSLESPECAFLLGCTALWALPGIRGTPASTTRPLPCADDHAARLRVDAAASLHSSWS